MSGINRCGPQKYNHRPSNKILPFPSYWISCPRIASVSVANSFVVFKTPLDERYENRLSESKRFNLKQLFRHLSIYELKLGLWFNLTDSTRYYGRFMVEQFGCIYVQLPPIGNEDLPDEETVTKFLCTCITFKENNPSQFIAVHCTLGFNRTGFFIVCYLVEVLHYDLANAIEQFAVARPPGIFRQHFIDELYKRYSREPPTKAPKPRWLL